MEIRQIKNFISVYETGSFTQAAQKAHIVQSALSISIKQLEEELGTPLFIRTTRKVSPTAAGKTFAQHAYQILHNIQAAVEDVEQVISLNKGSLSIGTVQSLPSFIDLPEKLAMFIKEFPGFDVKLCQGSAEKLNKKISDQKLDVAIMPIEEIQDKMSSKIIACDSLVLISNINHPINHIDQSLQIADLVGYTFIDFEKGQGTRTLNDESFSKKGLKRNIRFEVNDLDTLLELVKKGVGIAIIPEEIAEARGKELKWSEINDIDQCWELAITWSSELISEQDVNKKPVLDFLNMFTSYD